MQAERVLVVGLDGATFQVLDRLAGDGVVPCLGGMIGGGTRATLVSTVPPVTAPAWGTFLTGKDPGGHGVFDWRSPLRSPDGRRLLSRADLDGPSLPDICARHELQCLLLNIPMTYPAREVPGIMVTGMLTPGFESPFTWPTGLGGEPFWQSAGYQFDTEPPAGQDGGPGFIQRLCRMVRVRTSVALSLLKKVPQWRLCCIVFVATDRVQHYFWSAVDETHPQYDGTLSKNVRELWRTVDQSVSELFDEAGGSTPKMVLSDHGFGPLWKVVDLNAFLAREGLLTYRGRTLFRRLHLGLGIRARLGMGDADDSRTSAIDWARTVAYAGSETEEAVYVNLGGREPWGAVGSPSEYEDVRRKVRAVLGTLVDPETGDHVVVRCLPREEVYHGPRVDKAPDLLLELRPGYKVMNDLHRGSVVLPVGRGTYAGTGRHQRDGVLLMQGWGPVKQGPHHLRDVLPTILAALDCPAPQGLEGSSVLDT